MTPGKEREQELEVIYMMRPGNTTRQKPSREFAELHIRVDLHNPEALPVNFFLEFGLDGFGLLAVGSACRILVTNSVPIDIGPPYVASLEQAHDCCLSSLLLFDPTDDLVRVERQFAAGRESEERKTSGNECLSYGPRRTADQCGDLAQGKGGSKVA